MSQRKKPRKQKKNQRRVARSTRMESLEARQVMSADPLGVPALGHHAIVEEDFTIPSLSHHAIVEDEIPALTQHSIPSLSHHALLEPEPGAGELTHHAGLLPGGGSLNTGFFEPEPGYDPNADFWLDTSELESDGLGEQIDQLLNEAHQVTGQDEVVSKYGFDGAGQTVVVIDSGIAWDHYALGGGYGEGYRVVGGWDFTENDADPYDDGPAGAHGTHVAGIIGAENGGNDDGVATGVDLVGLRVFDDAGNGYFSWVEDALDWVHDNKDAFDSPITAVNLSLGTEWNSHSIPGWAMLEEEFAALEADGIFISVSAGNSFQNYNTPGVSYPAGSDHVIPVMSLDTNGQLSYFSQRAEYAIAAPGRWITSTVPDYAAGDADTITDDWASMSGTSMAAPYVAGASVLVREAMEFVGMTGIDQWDIFNHMMATGDQFFDSATSSYYTELNLEAAIDALMPTDDYGSTAGTAHDLGTIDPPSGNPLSQSQTSGVISTLDDADYFSFTAGATGTATFTVSEATHNLVVNWSGSGWNQVGEGVYTVDVAAGQTYTFAVATTDGLGYYDFSYELQSTFSPIEWGALGPQQTQSDLEVSGEAWYSVTAGAGGYLTADVVATTGAVTLEWYDAEQSLLVGDEGAGRVDTLAQQGEQFFLRVVGDAGDLDLRLTNAVSVDGSAVTVTGTAGDDAVEFTAGASSHEVTLNGLTYAFAAENQDSFLIDGGGGVDSVTVTGSAGDDSFTLRAGEVDLVGSGISVSANGFENVLAHGGGGQDVADLYDTAGADTYIAWSDRAEMRSGSYTSEARGFQTTRGHSTGGADRAYLYDGEGNDTYIAWSDRVEMRGGSFTNAALGFGWTRAFSNAGADRAYFYDTAGDETYTAWSDRAVMVGSGFTNDTRDFGWTRAYASEGTDRAYLYDTAGDETYTAWSDRAVMVGSGFTNDTRDFDWTRAASTGGSDRAFFYDTAGADTYIAWSDQATMRGDGYENIALGFAWTRGAASGGIDSATFYDGLGDDLLTLAGDEAILQGLGYENRALGFDTVDAHGVNGGQNTVAASAHDYALSQIGDWV